MQFRNPWVVGGLTIGGAVAGGIWGGTAVNTVIDEALYREERTEVLAPGPELTPTPQPGGLSGPV